MYTVCFTIIRPQEGRRTHCDGSSEPMPQPFKDRKRPYIVLNYFSITRHAIEQEECSNLLRIRQVF